MRTPIILMLAAAALVACDARQGQPRAPPAPLPAPIPGPQQVASTPPTRFYACADGSSVRARYPDADTAVIEHEGRMHTLKVGVSASGARYSGDGLQWWTRGLDRGALAPLAPGETFASATAIACKSPSPDDPVEPPAPGTPGGLPDDRTPISEAPFTPQSAQGAANVVQTYAALLGERKYGEAWRLWGDGGKASGMTEDAFARSFDRYAQYHANVGAPGEIEGAAGSLYVEVTLQAYGRLKSGEPFVMIGPVRLRRVNDVPGSLPEQRLWRIAATDLKPVPMR